MKKYKNQVEENELARHHRNEAERLTGKRGGGELRVGAGEGAVARMT